VIELKLIHLEGSSVEIGKEHGLKGKQKILRSLENYEKLFFGFQNLKWNDVREEAKKYIPAIESYNYSLLEEIQGVADGSGVDFTDILALNARSEIALAGDGESPFVDECTSIGVSSPLVADTIIGQNWDWIEQQKNNLLLLKIERENMPNIVMITEAGIIGKIGFNGHSIGVCLNALRSDKKKAGVPIHLGLRGVLDSVNLQEAIKKVHNGQMASAANFLIGYSEGKHKGMVLQTEVSPYGIDFINDKSGYGVHSNHICSPKLKQFLDDQNILRYSDSVIRYRRAEQLLQKSILNNEDITVNTFKDWFADDFNAPASINRFINEEIPKHEQTLTLFSVIIDLTRLEMHYCQGMPLNNLYEKIKY